MVDTHDIHQVEMDFFSALKIVKAGGIITKLEWDNKELHGMMIKEQLVLMGDDGEYHPWIISAGDMAGKDWIKLDEI